MANVYTFVLALSCCFSFAAGDRIPWNKSFDSFPEHKYSSFMQVFGRDLEHGSAEHRMREAIFQKRVREMYLHNSGTNSWKKGINEFSDFTDEEISLRMGYKPSPRAPAKASSMLELGGVSDSDACSAHGNSCLEAECCGGLVCGMDATCGQSVNIPEEHDWSTKLRTSGEILSQGACGSCWALAAAAVLQFHAEIKAKKEGKVFKSVISPQSLLDCTANPNECGGQGGCQGATAELAFDTAKGVRNALPLDVDPYVAVSQGCAANAASSFLQKQNAGLKIEGWRRLKTNDAADLVSTVVNVGPVAISIAANGLHSYYKGVFDNKDGDVIVNHAVTLMGYGYDKQEGKRYWNIRNSWGKDWGEKGFFRAQKYYPDPEPTAIDTEPDKGVACKDKEGHYPGEQEVSGTAGLLMDSAVVTKMTIDPKLLLDSDAANSASDDQSATPTGQAAEGSVAWCQQKCQEFAFDAVSEKNGRESDFAGSNGLLKRMRNHGG